MTTDAALAVRMVAVDPGLGAVVRGAGREAWVEALREMGARVRRVPLGVTEDRLGGGLDLAATLAAGRPVMMRGLLEEGGVMVLPMAERIGPGMAARLAAGAEDGAVGLVALDEGVGDEERVPGVLLERLALHVTVDAAVEGAVAVRGVAPGDVLVPEDVLEALCAAAAALGVGSMRAGWLAVRAARAAAAAAGRREVDAEDAAVAARLVLGPRATAVPAPEEAAADEAPGEEPGSEPGEGDASGQDEGGGAMEDVVLAAAKAAVPAGLLAQLAGAAAGVARRAGVAGAVHRGGLRGRPAGVRAGLPRATGLRLNLMETLRAAAPWQGVRGRGPGLEQGPVRLRAADFRVTRLKQRAETVTVFVVDASGSSALNRLAEAKGAVELLLAQSYVRRDRVGVVAFRGRGAEVLLPPTRSLVRAKRSLAGLPGGGGTPLAAGILAGLLMAEGERRRGATPTVVLLTDGRGNVALDGRGNRGVAETEALDAARRVRLGGMRAVLVDTSPRAHAPNRALAAAMGARYVALPAVDAASLSRAVRV